MGQDRHIVITGSSRGIGFALAREFLERGCRVMIAGRTAVSTDAALASLRAELPAHATRLDGAPCDVTDTAALQALWERARAHAPVDVWINNAGVSPPRAPLWEIGAPALEDVMNTNVRGLLLGAWVALRGMREQSGGGVIYNLEGFGGDGTMVRGALAYGASKRAVTYVTKALAREASEAGVRVCTIEPGAVRTDLSRAAWYGPGTSRLMLAAIEALAVDPPAVARLLVPRILGNRRTGARIRPWSNVVAWVRVLFLPVWGVLFHRSVRTLPTAASGPS